MRSTARGSPDVRESFYTLRGQGFGSGRLFAIGRDGGEPRIVLSGTLTPVTFSPGGRQIAFYREQFPDQDSSALIIADANGANERILATRRALPDGSDVVYVRRRALGSAPLRTLQPMATATGTGILSWAKDGSGIIATSNERFNVFVYPIDELFFFGTLSPDEKSLVASRGKMRRDTFQMRGFR